MIGAAVWIIFSDRFFGLFDPQVRIVNEASFVLASGVFLFYLINTGQKELRKTAHIAHEHEERYSQLVNTSPNAIAVHQDRKFVFVNPSMLSLLGVEKEDDILGKSIFDFVHPDFSKNKEQRIENLYNGIDDEEYPAELRFIKRDGMEIDVLVISNLITYNQKPAAQIIVMDISERKKREGIISDSLDEKTALLAEIHHRVKNNMAIISGLMELQSYGIEDPGMKKILGNSVARIKSIAMIHEQMYESHYLNKIKFDENIRALCQSLRKQLKETDGLQLEYDLEPVVLNVNQAVPSALFVNEAIMNVFTHSYPSGSGRCKISLYEENNRCSITIRDFGATIKADQITGEFKRLGVQLMIIVSEQLNGEFKVTEMNPGIAVSLSFDKEVRKKGSVANLAV